MIRGAVGSDKASSVPYKNRYHAHNMRLCGIAILAAYSAIFLSSLASADYAPVNPAVVSTNVVVHERWSNTINGAVVPYNPGGREWVRIVIGVTTNVTLEFPKDLNKPFKNLTEAFNAVVSTGAGGMAVSAFASPTYAVNAAVVTGATGYALGVRLLGRIPQIDAATNQLATRAYVDAATNQLASRAYVNAATNGLIREPIDVYHGGVLFTNSNHHIGVGYIGRDGNGRMCIRVGGTIVSGFHPACYFNHDGQRFLYSELPAVIVALYGDGLHFGIRGPEEAGTQIHWWHPVMRLRNPEGYAYGVEVPYGILASRYYSGGGNPGASDVIHVVTEVHTNIAGQVTSVSRSALTFEGGILVNVVNSQ